jgi:hypothetical protein
MAPPIPCEAPVTIATLFTCDGILRNPSYGRAAEKLKRLYDYVCPKSTEPSTPPTLFAVTPMKFLWDGNSFMDIFAAQNRFYA